METREKSTLTINFRSVMISFFQAKWVILFASLCLALSVFLFTTIRTNTYYTASTEIYIMDNTTYSASMNYADFQAAQTLTNDYKRLITNPAVLEPVIDKLGLSISTGALSRMIGVTAYEDTRIIVISVSNDDPYLAADIANTIREVASEKIVSTMGIDAVNPINEAKIPIVKQGAGSKLPTVFAFVFGIIISFCVVMIIDILNDTIKSPDEIVDKLGITTLGSIPYDPDLKKQLSKEGDK